MTTDFKNYSKELENSIKTLIEHTQHFVPTEDLEHLYMVIEAAEKVSKYETAEEEGRLKIFPCKVGDTLFVLTPDSPTGIETTKCIRLYIATIKMNITHYCHLPPTIP